MSKIRALAAAYSEAVSWDDLDNDPLVYFRYDGPLTDEILRLRSAVQRELDRFEAALASKDAACDPLVSAALHSQGLLKRLRAAGETSPTGLAEITAAINEEHSLRAASRLVRYHFVRARTALHDIVGQFLAACESAKRAGRPTPPRTPKPPKPAPLMARPTPEVRSVSRATVMRMAMAEYAVARRAQIDAVRRKVRADNIAELARLAGVKHG